MASAEFVGEHWIVLGLGRFGGGGDVVRYAVQQGARVTVVDRSEPDRLADALETLTDLDGVDYRLGRDAPGDLPEADRLVVNPAVPDGHPWLAQARRRAVPLATRINLFLERCPARIIGITGSNGKSTTTALTAHLLSQAAGRPDVDYRRVWLGGNIGNRPLLTCLDQITGDDWVVLELSSFQTERLTWGGRGVHVALLTNITPNHLDRHGTFEAYQAAKETLFRTQVAPPAGEVLSFFCGEDPVARQWACRFDGQPGRRCLIYRAEDVPASWLERFPLPGRANRCNLAGAVAVARALGVGRAEILAGIETFAPLPHRLETVAVVGGVRWVNDSIATTPESTLVALDAFDAPKILILGGYDKHVCFDDLGRAVARRAKAVVLLGQTADRLRRAIEQTQTAVPIARVETLSGAVEAARRFSDPGDVVLLSPACASYDMFENFQQRGEQFVRCVRGAQR